MARKKVKKPIHHTIKDEALAFRREFAKKILDLMTSGFGLVAALAWNELIREIISTYVKPFFGEGSGLISLSIYAVAVTLLAVLVTYNLSKIAGEKVKKKKK